MTEKVSCNLPIEVVHADNYDFITNIEKIKTLS